MWCALLCDFFTDEAHCGEQNYIGIHLVSFFCSGEAGQLSLRCMATYCIVSIAPCCWPFLSTFPPPLPILDLSSPFFFFSANHVWSLATITRLAISSQRLRYGAIRTHCDGVVYVHCFMLLSMYCLRGLPRFRLPSMYSATTVFVLWQPWSLQMCSKLLVMLNRITNAAIYMIITHNSTFNEELGQTYNRLA